MEKKEIINDSKTEGTIPWWVVVAVVYCFSKVLCSIFRSNDRDDEKLEELKKMNENLEDIKDKVEYININLDEVKYDVSRMRETVEDIKDDIED